MSSEPNFGLSGREQEILEYLYQGLTTREIADHIRFSEQNVKYYLSRIMEKLGVSTRAERALLEVRAEDANTACPVCSRPIGEHSHEQRLECLRKRREQTPLKRRRD